MDVKFHISLHINFNVHKNVPIKFKTSFFFLFGYVCDVNFTWVSLQYSKTFQYIMKKIILINIILKKHNWQNLIIIIKHEFFKKAASRRKND